MKTCKTNKLLGLALVSSFSLFSATNALAAAGDDITNTATLTFSVGGVVQPIEADSVTFKEDRKLLFDVVRGGTTGLVSTGGTKQATSFTLANNGNSAQGFLLKGLNNVNGTLDPHLGANDSFDGLIVETFIEVGPTPGYQQGEDNVAFVASLAVGASQIVYVVSTIPGLLADADVAVMTLVAQVAIDSSTGIAADAIMEDDNGHVSKGGDDFTNGAADLNALIVAGGTNPDGIATMETVFGDPAGTQDGDASLFGDETFDAQHSDDNSYTIASAVITVTKVSKVIYDPINLDEAITSNPNGPKAIPGAYIQYTITIDNDALSPVSADLTTLADVIVASGTNSVNLDTNLLDATKVLAATLVFPADSESPTADAVRIDTTGTNGRNGNAGTTTYCLGATAGCTYSGDPNGTVNVDFTAVAGMAAEAGYTAGELKPGEDVTVVFNVIVQ